MPCAALLELMHSRSRAKRWNTPLRLKDSIEAIVAMLEMTQAVLEMTDEELQTNPAVEQNGYSVGNILTLKPIMKNEH